MNDDENIKIHEPICMMCGKKCDVWEVVKTDDTESANGEELWHMDSEGTDNNAKIMSGMTIGENQMLYVSYIGGNVAAIKIFAGPEKSTWSCRGGNIHGTNQY